MPWSLCPSVQHPLRVAPHSVCLQYYFNPAGQRFRSRQEIMRHLELAAQQSKKVTREEAVANAKATAEQLGKQLPISLDNGVTVVRYAPRSRCGTHSFNQHGTYVMRHSLLFHFVCHSMSVYRSVWAACCIIFACCVDTCLLYHMLAAARAISALCTVTGQSFSSQASKPQKALHRVITASPITMQSITMRSQCFAAVPITMQLQ